MADNSNSNNFNATAPLEPIAVVGLALRLPGGANDADGLWELLESGRPAWTPVPEDRYNGDAFYHPNADDATGTSNHPGGHFISGDVRDFDNTFFKYSKGQAAAIDPQQRILLELAYEALESGGIPREDVAGTATSVYSALFPTDYDRNLYKDTLDMPTYYMSGIEKAMLSNRISHVMDLRGPSMTLDTACSGGLIALHLACQSLRDGESDTSIVGASNLTLGPDHFIGLSNLHMLSSTGRCYPFDQRGKGYGRGEGVVVLVLKRLDAAIRDRNPIRAVIRNTATGQDGYTPQGITYPNGKAQADLARTVYSRAGLLPEEVAYVEAHGTGTKAGDQEELDGIASVFTGSKDRSVPLYVGSIKGAIGHGESAAGLSSLVKATLMLERELIPPVAGFETPKPGLPLDKIKIPTEVIPFPQAAGITPRISINSFGFGGANAHVILEQGPRKAQKASCSDDGFSRLFTLSANSPASLKAMIQAQHAWVEQRAETPLADLSYTLLHRRSALPYRFSAVANDRASLLEALQQGIAGPAAKPVPAEVDIVAVFTGQGSQWAGMGRELLLESNPSPIFRDSIRKSRDILNQMGADWDLETELLRNPKESRINEAMLAQPSTTAIQIALLELLQAQGVHPRAVVGFSSGEIAAAYAAGHLTHETALKVAYHSGFMVAAVKAKGLPRGAMLSVGLGEHDASKYLENLPNGKAVIACIASPRSVTISGDADAIEEVDNRINLANDGTFHRLLQVDTAYHSHHMEAVAQEYRDRLGVLDVECRPTSDGKPVDFVSSVSGEAKSSGFDAEYWIDNLVKPVRFSDAVETLVRARHQSGQNVFFVEVGPHPALAGPVRQTLQQPDMPQISYDYQAPLQRKFTAIESTLTFSGKLFERGVRVNWDPVSALAPGADTAVVRHDLPAYPWDHSTKHWQQSRVTRAYLTRKEPYHDLLGVPVPDATDLEPRWRHFISKASLPWLEDYVVDGVTTFPSAGFVSMAVEAVAQLARRRIADLPLEAFSLRDVYFKRGLVVPDRERVELQLSLRPQSGLDFGFTFTITALSHDDNEWYEHATGVVEAVVAEGRPSAEAAAPEELPQLPSKSEIVSREVLYREIEAVGNKYGPSFAGLDSFTIASDASQALSSFGILDIKASMPRQHQRPHVVHPSTLEIVFHSSLPLVGRRLGSGTVTPMHIEELLISTSPSLQKPSTKLDISTQISSSHLRTAVSNISVLASGDRVLSVSGMEFKSVGSSSAATTDAESAANARNICYELGWKPDVHYVRAEDLPESPALADLLTLITSKKHGLTTIGLGATVDTSEEVLTTIESQNRVIVHDFVDSTPGRFDAAAARLGEFQVQYRTLRPQSNPALRGFRTGAYDLVLVGSAQWLNQAAILVRPGGTVLLVFSGRNAKGDAWRATLQGTKPTQLEEQLAFREAADGRLIAVAKPSRSQLPGHIHIVTHSTSNAPAWVTAVQKALSTSDAKISLNTFDSLHVEALTTDDTVVVIDDKPDTPIIAEAATFHGAKTLLSKPSRLVWLAPDEARFHQITGFARTAHAENDDLRMTTIHAASGLLAKESAHERLVSLVADAVRQVADRKAPHEEREYRIRTNGAVVVPRIHRNETINTAVTADGETGPKTETVRFADSKRPLALASDGSPFFEDDNNVYATPLAVDAIEVEVQALVVSATEAPASLGQYAGIVAKVGANVSSLTAGDRVVALSPVVGASRLRIPRSHAARIPADVQSSTASALLLNAMSALYAIRDVAHLSSSESTVLIHGARTAAGRAAVALARSIGARVTVTAADAKEARLLKEQLQIDAADVLVARRSLHRRSAHEVFAGGLDAIIQIAEDAFPVEALAFVKPFGNFVVIGHPSSPVASAPKMPPNMAFHFVDISALLQARADLAGSLVTSAVAALENTPLAGLDVEAFDVSEAAEALKLANANTDAKVVLHANPDSTVQVLSAPNSDPWADEEATYVVAGGLGDIGQRFLAIMASRGAKHIATITRRGVDPETYSALQAKLEAIRPGFRLYALKGDLSSESSVREAAAEATRQGAPPVRGVIQSAKVMIDRPLELTTYDDFQSATASKVNGTLNLRHVFGSPNLKFFLSLSSVSNIVGCQAEASYNAGNSLQDSLAHQEKHLLEDSTRFLTINIGWTDDASLLMHDATRQGVLRRAGFGLTRSEELSRFIDHVLGVANGHEAPAWDQAIIGFDTESLAGATAHNGPIKSNMFSQVRDAGRAASGEQDQGEEKTFEQVIAEGNVEAVVEYVSRAVSQQLARLISVDASSIDLREGSILELGLDSLVAVELRNFVTRQFVATLKSSDILANQSLWALGEKIAARSKMVNVSA